MKQLIIIMGVLIKKYCEENFSERAIINSLTKVYSEVLGDIEAK